MTYAGTGGLIADYSIGPQSTYFFVEVDNLPDNYTIEQTCLHIRHQRPSDLKIALYNPSNASIWLSNRNGLANRYGYLNTCFSALGFDGYVQDDRGLFDGEFVPEGLMQYVSQGPQVGTWLLEVTDLQAGTLGKVESLELHFAPAIAAADPCTIKHPSGCTASEVDGGRLLPDLLLAEPLTIEHYQYFGSDSGSEAYRNQLRLAAAIANVGMGPFEILVDDHYYCGEMETSEPESPCPDGKLPTARVRQLVYRLVDDNWEVDTILGGVMRYDDSPGHQHYHVDDWIEMKLLKRQWWRRSKHWPQLGLSNKVSYCLFDNMQCSSANGYCDGADRSTLANYSLGTYRSCSSDRQGISVGGIDYYGMLYEGQAIDLDVPLSPGTYYLEITVDPYGHYLDADRSNNRSLLKIVID